MASDISWPAKKNEGLQDFFMISNCFKGMYDVKLFHELNLLIQHNNFISIIQESNFQLLCSFIMVC